MVRARIWTTHEEEVSEARAAAGIEEICYEDEPDDVCTACGTPA